MKEKWERIRGLPKHKKYEVSSLGRIRNKSTGRILSTHCTNSGYERVMLGARFKGKLDAFHVHRLVAEHFLECPSSDLVVNHKDGNKLNNSVKNLEFCTRSENKKHAYNHLKIKPHNISLSKEMACEIRRKIRKGRAQYKLAEEYGVSKMVISRLKRFIQKEYQCICKTC